MLTDGSADARRLAALLAAAGIKFEILTFAYPPATNPNASRLQRLKRRAHAFVKSLRLLRAIWQFRLPRFPARARYVGYCNGKRMLRALEKLRPDYVVMRGGCILSAAAIRTARVGVLNAHPGLLPWIRGMNVLEHSLLRDIPLGATGHFIDAGIDTGPIVLRYLLPIEEPASRPLLRDRLTDLSLGIMLEMVVKAVDGAVLPRVVQGTMLPYCRRATPEENRRADELIRAGKAHDLYREWKNEDRGIADGLETLQRVSRLAKALT